MTIATYPARQPQFEMFSDTSTFDDSPFFFRRVSHTRQKYNENPTAESKPDLVESINNSFTDPFIVDFVEAPSNVSDPNKLLVFRNIYREAPNPFLVTVAEKTEAKSFRIASGLADIDETTRLTRDFSLQIAEELTENMLALSSNFVNATNQIVQMADQVNALGKNLAYPMTKLAEGAFRIAEDMTDAINFVASISRQFGEKINRISTLLMTVFAEAQYYEYDDFLGSEVEKKFSQLLQQKPSIVLIALNELMEHDQSFEINSQNLILSISVLRDNNSHDERRLFVERILSSDNKFIRDSAATGLSFLNDEKSIPALAEAIEKENFEGLKEDLQSVLRQIEEMGNGPIFPDGK